MDYVLEIFHAARAACVNNHLTSCPARNSRKPCECGVHAACERAITGFIASLDEKGVCFTREDEPVA